MVHCIMWQIMDNFAVCTLATPQINDACVALFKHTQDEITLKVDAFITTGLPGVLHMAGKSSPMKRSGVIHQLCLVVDMLK